MRWTLADSTQGICSSWLRRVSKRDAQNALVAVVDKLLEHRFAADDVIAVQLDLIRLEQQHAGRIQKKLRSGDRNGQTHNSGDGENQHAAIERPAPPAEFLAADFDGLLAAQVARLLVGNQLRPVGLGLLPPRSRSVGWPSRVPNDHLVFEFNAVRFLHTLAHIGNQRQHVLR